MEIRETVHRQITIICEPKLTDLEAVCRKIREYDIQDPLEMDRIEVLVMEKNYNKWLEFRIWKREGKCLI